MLLSKETKKLLILRRSDYKKGAVDRNNYLNNLKDFSVEKKYREADLVVYVDERNVYLAKVRDVVSQLKDIITVVNDNCGDLETALGEYDRMISMNALF